VKEHDTSEFLGNVTDEQRKRYDEIYNKMFADPAFLYDEYPPMPIPDPMREWLLNKYRAAYDMAIWVTEIKGETVEEDSQKREEFAALLANIASARFQSRFAKALPATIQALIIDLDQMMPAFLKSVFEGADARNFKQALPTRKQVTDVWEAVIECVVDPRFIRDGRGGDRRSGAKLTEAERVAIVERKSTLTPFWSALINQFESNNYEDDVWEWIKTRKPFKEQCAKYSITSPHILNALVPQVLKRKTYWNKEFTDRMPESLSPAAFALQHAALEMGVSDTYAALKKKVAQKGKRQ